MPRPFLLLVGLRTCRFDLYVAVLLLLACLDTDLVTRDSDSFLDLRSCFYSRSVSSFRFQVFVSDSRFFCFCFFYFSIFFGGALGLLSRTAELRRLSPV